MTRRIVWFAWFAWFAAAIILLGACTKSGGGSATPTGTSGTGNVSPQSPAAEATPSAPSPAGEDTTNSLSGSWSGTWADTTDQASATFDLKRNQQGNKLTGTIKIEGTACLSGGKVTGTLNGLKLDFGVVSAEVKISCMGAWDGKNKMSGSYSTTCFNAKGSL